MGPGVGSDAPRCWWRWCSPCDETRTVDVPLDDPSRAADVTGCRLGEPATRGSGPAATRTPAPGSTSGGSTSSGTGTPKPGASKSRKPR